MDQLDTRGYGRGTRFWTSKPGRIAALALFLLLTLSTITRCIAPTDACGSAAPLDRPDTEHRTHSRLMPPVAASTPVEIDFGSFFQNQSRESVSQETGRTSDCGIGTHSSQWVQFRVTFRGLRRKSIIRGHPSKVILSTGSGYRILDTDNSGSALSVLTQSEQAAASVGSLYCGAVNDDGYSATEVAIALTPDEHTLIDVPIDVPWPRCFIHLRGLEDDGVAKVLHLSWNSIEVDDVNVNRSMALPWREHGIDLREFASLRGDHGTLSYKDPALPDLVILSGIVQGLTAVDAQLVRSGSGDYLHRSAIVRVGEELIIDFSKPVLERVVTMIVDAGGAILAPGSIQFVIAGHSPQSSFEVDSRDGPVAEIELRTSNAYVLRVRDPIRDVTLRKFQLALDEVGRIRSTTEDLRISGRDEHQVVAIALGKKFAISLEQLREMRTVCDGFNVRLHGDFLPVYAGEALQGSARLLINIESLVGQGTGAEVFATKEARIVASGKLSGQNVVEWPIEEWFHD